MLYHTTRQNIALFFPEMHYFLLLIAANINMSVTCVFVFFFFLVDDTVKIRETVKGLAPR